MRRQIKRFPQNGETQVFELIDQIYAAATDGARWPVLLESLAKSTGSEIANITLYDSAFERGDVEWYFGGDPTVALEFGRHWAAQNPYMDASLPLLRTGVVMRGEDLVQDSVAKRTAFFNEFLTRLGVWYHTGTSVFWEDSLRVLLTLSCKIGKPSHRPEDLALLRTLTPHLQRAVSVYRRLQQVELERTATDAALDRLPLGVVVLGTGGKVHSYNASAGSMFEQNDGLSLGRAGMQASHVKQGSKLHWLIDSACGPTNLRPAGGWLQVSRPSGRRPFVVLVAPLRLRESALGLDPPKAIAFITDPERAPGSLQQTLACLFGLTPAESKVVEQLLSGASVAELADQLAITVYTVRTHMKRIFDKLGVRTQAELVRVLLSGVAGLRTDDTRLG